MVVSGKKIFKRWSSVLVFCVVSACFAVVAVSFGVPSAIDPGNWLRSVTFGTTTSLFAAGMIWLFFSVGVFPGIEVRDDVVVVKNFLYDIYIPAGSVSGVSWNGGISIRSESGKYYPCHAFPNSLYSLVFRYRNFRRVAKKIEKALGGIYYELKGPAIRQRNAHVKFFFLTLGGVYLGFWACFFIFRF